MVIFGATSSPSIAEHCFRRTADEFCEDEAAKKSIKEDTYVDDVITGADDAHDAVKLVDSITKTLQRGGFRLGPWASNSDDVLCRVGQGAQQEQGYVGLKKTLGCRLGRSVGHTHLRTDRSARPADQEDAPIDSDVTVRSDWPSDRFPPAS